MEISDLLKDAAGVIREFSESLDTEAKVASGPEFYLDLEELRSLADAK